MWEYWFGTSDMFLQDCLQINANISVRYQNKINKLKNGLLLRRNDAISVETFSSNCYKDELHSKFQMSRELDEFGPQNYALFSMRLYQGVMPHFLFP